MKTGLVLEGGAMRGLFTAGVIDVMMEQGINYDGIIGVSAGAAFGCNYISRQPGRVIRYNKAMVNEWRFCSIRSLLFTGDLIGAEFAYHTLPDKIDIFDRDAYNANPTEFIAVCTDVESGKAVYKLLPEATDLSIDWIRASASMPMCSRVVRLEGYGLLDGGISDSIPLEHMESRGYDKCVVVLTQPEGFVKTPTKAMPLMKMWLRKYPRLVEALRNRHEMYNAQLQYVADAVADGRAYVIQPPEKLPIGHICHDPALMQEVYEIGRAEAMKHISAIKDFL